MLGNGTIEIYLNVNEKQTTARDDKRIINLNDNLAEQIPKQKCLQIEYHSIYNNILIILYAREFLIFDLTVSKRTSSVKLENSSSSFVQVI